MNRRKITAQKKCIDLVGSVNEITASLAVLGENGLGIVLAAAHGPQCAPRHGTQAEGAGVDRCKDMDLLDL